MRGRLFALLLCTTAITAPVEVKAAPVLPFIGGFLNAVGVGTFLTTAAGVGAWTAGFAVGEFLTGTLVGRLLLSTAINKLLAPKQGIPPQSAIMGNYAQPVSYADWVFGITRKGGPLGFTAFSGHTDIATGIGGDKRHYSPIIAAHAIDGVLEHWIDESPVEIDGDGVVITGPRAGYYRVRPFFGNQSADAEMIAAFPEITELHDFKGLSGAHVWAKRPSPELFSEVYPSGREGAYAPVVKGHNKIYDPRDGLYKFTNNAALVLAFVITNIIGHQVDWDDVAVEADYCDEIVVNGSGGAQPRWTINGSFSSGVEADQVLALLGAACDAFFYERPDGKAGFKVGRFELPAITLTNVDFFSLEASQGEWGASAPTAVSVIYTEPQNKWKESASGTIVFDGEERKAKDTPSIPFITNHNQAWRVGSRVGAMKRPKWSIQGTVGMIGYDLIGHRFITVEHPILGGAVVFEVEELTRNAGGATFNLSAHSVNESDFNMDALADEPPIPVLKEIAEDNTVKPVSGFVGAANDGASITWSWIAQDESLTQQIRMRKVGDADWQYFSSSSGQTIMTMGGLIDGVAYEAQIRNQTPALRPSVWNPDVPVNVTVVANSIAPIPLLDFTAVKNGYDADISVTSDNDPNYYATHVYRATGSTDIASASIVHTIYGQANSTETWTDIGAPVGDVSYWGAPVNRSGIDGPKSGPVTITFV